LQPKILTYCSEGLSLCFLLLAVVVLSSCSSLPDMKTGQKAYEDGNYATAKQHYEELAEFGVPEAKVELGRMYLYGRGVDSDPHKALSLFEEAQQSGKKTAASVLIPKAQAKIASNAEKEARAAARRNSG
jgi:TPR repeat protein